MSNLLCIIHPYTYNMVGSELRVGRIAQYEKRNQAIRQFSEIFQRAIVHYRFTGMMESAFDRFAISREPDLRFMLNLPRVITASNGLPIMDEKPDHVKQELWDKFKDIFTKESELKKAIGTPKRVFLIGGILENCITNYALHHHNNYMTNGEELFYVPELCVSLDETHRRMMEEVLAQNGIQGLELQTAIELAKTI